MGRGGRRAGAGRPPTYVLVPPQTDPCEACSPRLGANWLPSGPEGYCCRQAFSSARRQVIYADRRRRGIGTLQLNEKQMRAPDNFVGAANELTVAADLLRRGYAVFRSVTMQAPFDLVAVRGTTVERVEVKSQVRVWDKTLFDVLAVVGADGQVRYFRAESEM
jgi:PD-(D/E)XK endonuclease